MISDLPVESVNGQEEWNWNEQQAARTAPNASISSADRRPDGTERAAPPERTVAAQREVRRLEAEVGALESELEQTEQRLEHVIEQYERVLTRKNQQLDEQEEPASGRSSRTVRSVLSRWIPGGW
ncbi:hypothetical protein FK85_11115 [Halorubrum saccharovorum]|uniref:Nucleotide exchange factor GrpE n=1 Tax=Halorubrum saccharovorum TaxID=2248 RepID=A0A081ETH0_9EURY|nr:MULTISPECIES: hypothetical protein [Halorubrum]KDS90708.1 hypothetical protein FK85_11115 [Halorubrum saccharovorum]